jgi:hypothetical protein
VDWSVVVSRFPQLKLASLHQISPAIPILLFS